MLSILSQSATFMIVLFADKFKVNRYFNRFCGNKITSRG